MVKMLRGDVAADELCETLRGQVAGLLKDHGVTPGLAVVLVGDDPASAIYVRRKLQRSSEVGIRSIERRMPVTATEAELLAVVVELNQDPDVHGILVQLPLPPQIDSGRVLDAIDPTKDVDGFHPVNVGRLSTGTGGLVPCTPLGVMRLLDRVIPDFAGLEAVVIGRSNIVGKPVALLLLERGCTVTVAHSRTRDLSSVVARADVVVAAAGRPGLIRGEWVKAGAVVIDVGINRIETPDGRAKIVGDVSASELEHAAYLSPVPGGVGPMTIACLLANTVKAARERTKV